MRYSLSTGTLYVYPLRLVFRWARQAGFDGVELVITPEAIARGGRAVQQLAEEEGIEILTAHPTVVPLPGWRERGSGMDRTIQLVQETGARLVVMHVPRSERLDGGEGLALQKRIESWQPRLLGSGLRLALENKSIRAQTDWRYALTPLEELRAFADRFDLGLVLDTTHAGTANEDLVRARQVFDGRLANVHLSDMAGILPAGVSPVSMLPDGKVRPHALQRVEALWGQHRFPGGGDLSLAGLMADLARSGYTGPVTLEINPFAARVWWPPAVRRRLAQAIAWMKNAAA